MQIVLRSGPFFIHETIASPKPVQTKSRGRWMMVVRGNQMGKSIARGRNRLKPAITPSTIQIETFNMRLINDRASVRRHVHDAPPGAQDFGLPDNGHQRHRSLHHMFLHRKIAPCRIRGVIIKIAPKNQTALIGFLRSSGHVNN